MRDIDSKTFKKEEEEKIEEKRKEREAEKYCKMEKKTWGNQILNVTYINSNF